ncbi:MAG: zinc metalloprotease HtpX [Pseudomonadota bacterium]
MATVQARRHAAVNRLQTLLLVAALLGICALAGGLLFGPEGMVAVLVAAGIALLLAPTASARVTLALYRARPLLPQEAPGLWRAVEELAARAGLPAVPKLHYMPSGVVNAFTVGNPVRSAIVLTDGLLRTLTLREIAGVLAHEIAHIAHGDLRVMGLADYVSRITSVLALTGQLLLLAALPAVAFGTVDVSWAGLLLLAVSPHLALLAQLGLSRVREYDADLKATELTGDPEGLASALARIERVSRSWHRWLLPGWGNPEPSWLRTHPATEERIRRLLSLARSSASPWPGGPGARRVRRAPATPPRRHPGGVWR